MLDQWFEREVKPRLADDFLGFTHYCGRSRQGNFQLKRKTSTKKLRTKLLDLNRWFHQQLDTPIGEMWRTLNAKLHGHYQYYGINDNWPLSTNYGWRVGLG